MYIYLFKDIFYTFWFILMITKASKFKNSIYLHKPADTETSREKVTFENLQQMLHYQTNTHIYTQRYSNTHRYISNIYSYIDF